jgi:replicative DNA helicase
LRHEDRLELHDLVLERAVLCAAMLLPGFALASKVVPDDFYSHSNGQIFAVLCKLASEGKPHDTAALHDALHDAGRLGAVGGDEYLLAVTETMPSDQTDTRRLRRLARRRAVHDAAALVAGKAGSDELPRYLAALDGARAALEAVDRDESVARIPTLSELALALGAVGTRLPTGLPALDAATRGGLPLGRFVALLGAPGASKTNLCAWLADGWERAGCAVAFLAADESREAIVTRLGQLDGHDREALEGVDPGRRETFARSSRARAIVVIDPYDDELFLEDAERLLLEGAGDRPRVMFVDSIQTVPCREALQYETTREQIEATVRVIKRICRRGTLVVAISEMSRAGYRTGKRDQDISALGAGAESRAIEYAAHLLIGLRSVTGEVGVVDLEVAKNRLGSAKPEIRTRLDFSSLSWREIEKPEHDDVDRERAKSTQLRERALAACAREECRTLAAIIRGAGMRKRDGNSITRELVEEGVLVRVDGVYRVAQPGVPS